MDWRNTWCTLIRCVFKYCFFWAIWRLGKILDVSLWQRELSQDGQRKRQQERNHNKKRFDDKKKKIPARPLFQQRVKSSWCFPNYRRSCERSRSSKKNAWSWQVKPCFWSYSGLGLIRPFCDPVLRVRRIDTFIASRYLSKVNLKINSIVCILLFKAETLLSLEPAGQAPNHSHSSPR